MKWTPLEEGFHLHLMYSEFSTSHFDIYPSMS
jgi:hypothetical protein